MKRIRESDFFSLQNSCQTHRREILNEEKNKNKNQNQNAAGSDTKLQGHFIPYAVSEQSEVTVAI